MDTGGTDKKRAVLVRHRRAGKDKDCWNYMVKEAFLKRGNYYYFFPTYKQGKKAVWDAIDKDGTRFLDHIPKEIIEGKPNETELKIRLINGSTIQIIGTENIDNVMGTPPRGVIFSEYSLQNPRAWDYIRPILKENNGWAIFNGTPRGENHLYDILDTAKHNTSWFYEVLTINDTGVLTEADMEEERSAGMSEEMIQQEYYCDFTSAMSGSYYGAYIRQAMQDGRIGEYKYDSNYPVFTSWDLGVNDPTAIIFFQVKDNKVYIIDYYEQNDIGLKKHVEYVLSREYVYHQHFWPHDGKQKDSWIGKRRDDLARKYGLHVTVLSQFGINDGIELVRSLLPSVHFNENTTKDLINSLKNYVSEYDEIKRVYKQLPLHNWASHGADAFRYLALAYRDQRPKEKSEYSRLAVTADYFKAK